MLFLICLGAVSNTIKNVLVHISLLITVLFCGEIVLKEAVLGQGVCAIVILMNIT